MLTPSLAMAGVAGQGPGLRPAGRGGPGEPPLRPHHLRRAGAGPGRAGLRRAALCVSGMEGQSEIGRGGGRQAGARGAGWLRGLWHSTRPSTGCAVVCSAVSSLSEAEDCFRVPHLLRQASVQFSTDNNSSLPAPPPPPSGCCDGAHHHHQVVSQCGEWALHHQ